MNLKKQEIYQMFLSVAELFLEKSDILSEIDSRFGDGDHGVTIKKIALLIKSALEVWDDESIGEFIDDLGVDIMAVNGGSAGPLYGTMVSGMAVPLTEEDEIDAILLKRMFLGMQDEMFGITNARVGDKTMMDALIPAVEAAKNSVDDIEMILMNAAYAAENGAKTSEGYVAKFGRARSYKEKTIGTPDAGAVSTAAFFTGIYEGYKESKR